MATIIKMKDGQIWTKVGNKGRLKNHWISKKGKFKGIINTPDEMVSHLKGETSFKLEGKLNEASAYKTATTNIRI